MLYFELYQPSFPFFFFNDTATTEIYTLSLHDALPISLGKFGRKHVKGMLISNCTQQMNITKVNWALFLSPLLFTVDRKSTRLNSSHVRISYAVFCLKKKKIYKQHM